MSSNPRFHQKKGVRKLSELFIQSLLGRQNFHYFNTSAQAPSGACFVFGWHQSMRHAKPKAALFAKKIKSPIQ